MDKNRIVKKFKTPDNKEVSLIYIANSLSDDLIKQLLDYSKNDEVVRKNSSDGKRFADIESFNKWLKKGRTIYILTDNNQKQLLGFFWFGLRPLSKETIQLDEKYKDLKIANFNITIAYRLYKGLRGKRMFTKTFAQAIKDLVDSDFYKNKKEENLGNFWLETGFNNTNSINAMQKLRFNVIGKNPEKNKRAFLICKDENLNIGL